MQQKKKTKAKILREPKAREKHKLLFKQISDNIRKGQSMEEAMLAIGYSPSYAKSSTHLKETDSWRIVTNTVLSDERLGRVHNDLLNATRLDHSVFPPHNESGKKKKKLHDELTDELIIELLASVNCVVKKIVHGEQARHVYFWSADNRARKEGLDMAYKIKNKYAPETMNFKFAGYDKKQLIDMVLTKLKKK